jgi:creatinine amidohydrolase
MPRPNYKLASMTYEEAQRVIERGAVALLPCGSTEAHGPHLPLETDVIIAIECAMRAASQLAREDIYAVVLPPIAYAVTELAEGFAGTISLPPDALRDYVRAVCMGAVRAGLRGVVLCNAHLEPASIDVLRSVSVEALARGTRVHFPDITRQPHAQRLGAEFRSGACHAGNYETSLVMATDPFQVREVASELPANPTSLTGAIREGKRTFVEAGGLRAYFGDPASASASGGDELYDELADIFAASARELLAP